MQQLGCRMVAVSDANGAIRSDEGIDADRLQDFISGGGKITEFEGADAIDPEDLIGVECDVFIPAALGGMIHEGNADRMQCRMVIEGANSPTTPAADRILADKGTYVIPDVMANAGGVVVSYFEWVQNLQHFRWEEREVNDKLGTIMRRTYREVSSRAKEEGIPLRESAYLVGIERVVAAARTRGYVS
jgi:glutamate dehydrogenase/leucine dehydrogenase